MLAENELKREENNHEKAFIITQSIQDLPRTDENIFRLMLVRWKLDPIFLPFLFSFFLRSKRGRKIERDRRLNNKNALTLMLKKPKLHVINRECDDEESL